MTRTKSAPASGRTRRHGSSRPSAFRGRESNFLTNVDKALSFMADVGRPSLSLLLDTFHMNIEEPGFLPAIDLAGRRLGHAHLVDSNRMAPGEGHIDFEEILRKLREIGYDGYLPANPFRSLTTTMPLA